MKVTYNWSYFKLLIDELRNKEISRYKFMYHWYLGQKQNLVNYVSQSNSK